MEGIYCFIDIILIIKYFHHLYYSFLSIRLLYLIFTFIRDKHTQKSSRIITIVHFVFHSYDFKYYQHPTTPQIYLYLYNFHYPILFPFLFDLQYNYTFHTCFTIHDCPCHHRIHHLSLSSNSSLNRHHDVHI